MRSILAGAALLLAPALASGTAHADTLGATRAQKLTETAHDVRITVRDGVATYRVQRTFQNAGKLHEEAVLDIGLPFGAAATGLRIKTPSGWYAGELMRAERAAQLYQELTGFGVHTVKDPALLSWRWANGLSLQVFPIAPDGGTSTIEYTLTGPTRYQDGRYVVSYPRASEGLAAPTVRIGGRTQTREAWLNGVPIGEEVKLAAAQPPAWDESGSLPETFAFSELDIGENLKATKLSVAMDIRHTYRGDLRVVLVPPKGPWHDLVPRDGGSENDINKTVEVTLGDSAVDVAGKWRLVVIDEAALDVGSIDSWSITLGGGDKDKKFAAKDLPKFIPDAPSGEAHDMGVIQIAPPPIHTVAARLGRVEASPTKQFLRLEVDAAPQLRRLPQHLQVAFVVDASKSVGSHGLESQLTVVRSFLKHTPDAHVEIVVYRRKASRLFGAFVPAAELDERLAKAEANGDLALQNGSALDEGIRVAGDALQTQKGTRMMVMASDDLLRPAWKNDASRERLGQLSLYAAHVVLPRVHPGDVPWTGDSRERRDDKHTLAALAAKTGGILLHIDQPSEANKELDDVTLGLVRPTRIDHFRVQGVTLPAGHELPAVLHEGEGIREMALLEHAPSQVTLVGKIWSHSFSRVVKGPLRFSEATAAFVFSHDMHDGLSEEEMVRVAFAGKVVSPVTSYLAVEPGVRPSNVGLRGVGEGGGGFGEGIGLGGLGTIGHGGAPCPPYSIEGDVAAAIQACTSKHPAAPSESKSFTVHTTYTEVVDVVRSEGDTSALATCLADALWQANLPSCHFGARRDKVIVKLP